MAEDNGDPHNPASAAFVGATEDAEMQVLRCDLATAVRDWLAGQDALQALKTRQLELQSRIQTLVGEDGLACGYPLICRSRIIHRKSNGGLAVRHGTIVG